MYWFLCECVCFTFYQAIAVHNMLNTNWKSSTPLSVSTWWHICIICFFCTQFIVFVHFFFVIWACSSMWDTIRAPVHCIEWNVKRSGIVNLLNLSRTLSKLILKVDSDPQYCLYCFMIVHQVLYGMTVQQICKQNITGLNVVFRNTLKVPLTMHIYSRW